ncbi:hypothetical protein CKA34_10815 [Rhizobium sp. 11515TR]|nr:hypothetical protein CKA34_10815 [Rhizobium sp. 11515TR]
MRLLPKGGHITQFRNIFREPNKNEGFYEYVIPRAIILFMLFMSVVMGLIVVGTYLPTAPLI